jgi:two-component system, NarL family, response regulator DevR
MSVLPTTTVLLVDDHPMVREGVRHALSSAADIAIVGEAQTAAAALELAAQKKPDVILLDISLPDASGLDLLGDLRAEGCAVVVFSFHRGERHVREAMEAGASGYLVKSAEPHEIVAAIRDAGRGEVPLSAEAATSLVEALRRQRRPGRVQLTPREREVWRLLAAGLSNAAIAKALFISEHTAKFHVHNLLRKLGVKTRAEAIIAAQRAGLE